MENVQEKSLTLEDKAKLKERLALLKKEYKRTVNRLQKSERAEMVKTHVKRIIEEQNRLLNQESTGQDSGLLSAGHTSNASGDPGDSHTVFERPLADKQRKPCVSFNLNPEIVNSDCMTPLCSSGESSGQEAEGNKANQSSHISRSRLKLSRSGRRVCFSESPSPRTFPVSSLVNVLDGKEGTGDRSLSPVFKKHPTDGAPLKPDNSTARYCSEDTKPKDVAHEVIDSSGTALLLLGTADNSPGKVKNNYDTLQSVGAEITTCNNLVQYCVENESSKSKAKEEQPLPSSKPSDTEAACNLTCCLLATPPPQTLDLENPTDLKTTSQPSSSLSPQNQTLANLKVPTESTVIKEERNPFCSCTLVEGLLFPVEYYIRTTRRMTSCQRKVDLDAVISNHLGTGRKGSRGRSRRNSTSLSTPISTGDKLSNSLTPLSRPAASSSAGEVTRSKRGRGRKSCPAVLTSGLKEVSVQLKFGAENSLTPSGSQSEKENCEETLARKETHNTLKYTTHITAGSQKKEVGRFMTFLSDKKTYRLRSQEASVFNVHTSAGEEDGKLCNLRNTKEASNPTSSPIPLLSGRVNLDHLSHCLKITDFHLPDEDFGILKLEKLKSLNHLELFTPHMTRERRRCSQLPKNDSNTGSTEVLQEGDLGARFQKSEEDLKLLETKESCLKVNHPPCSKESTLENVIEKPSNVAEPSHSSSGEPPNGLLPEPSLVISGVLASKEKTSNPPTNGFPINPSPNNTNHSHTNLIQERPLPDNEIAQTIFPTTPHNLSGNGKQACIPVTEASEVVESVGANPDLHKNIDDHTISDIQCKLSSKLHSSVLLSTSLCSVPLESMNEFGDATCTPGLPYLGSTPALLPLLQSSSTSVACSPAYKGQEEILHSEVCVEEDHNYTEDTKQHNDVLGQDYTMMVKGHCEDLEHEEKSLPAETHKDKSFPVMSEEAANEDTETVTVTGGHLHLLSEIKDSCGNGFAVDLCPVWWEFSESPELCIVSASESSVCLWRPQAEGTWECSHIWTFTEMPVIQILPLSQEKNIFCVALGNLEITEIWALFTPPKKLGWEKQLVKRGQVKTALGLSRHRLVSSGIGEDSQVVEVQQLSETGSTVESLLLEAPRNGVLAFCEVEGERDALVGSTVDTYVVVWNAVTGHLLSVIFMGDHCSDLTCLSATSDSGLLFLVVGSLFSKPCEEAGSCVFKLIATNPRGGASTSIMSYVFPDKSRSRYLEGDVKRQKAAAVLTCGCIALWDLSKKHYSIALPPSLDAPWCLVRWSHSPSCLLTGKKDGTICIYKYTEHCSDEKR
ncbi:partner and localizer of BRCA2 isoform X2 [Pyxicephalus adspersus]|uniref:partner and localizer of BRCA2 isoform X2 n=1 Tax=Pyxicephalus adspersus TaxID=30357 RepID=UPI003B5CE014